MKLLSVEALAELIERHGFDAFMLDLMYTLERDYARWELFTKMPRPAMHVPGGVLELMPVCDEKYYTFKYVNCHPKNPDIGQQTVVATGQLSRIDTGYPLLFSEMTVLTAFRTAANTALATDHMARKDARVMALIGTGAQSEFQVRALQLVRTIQEVRYFDIDASAMDKFARNMGTDDSLKLTQCRTAEEAVKGADIVTVCTACKQHVDVIKNTWIKPGVHINAIGGDCPGKTELELSILARSHIVVEYFDQTFIEGEIQRFSKTVAKERVYAELYEVIRGTKQGRATNEDITLFDSVGIALEDYSALRLVHELSDEYDIGESRNFTPTMRDPKNLVSTVMVSRAEPKIDAANVLQSK
ncbi:MAG TPA: ornithine cyclodeaminase [Patescibacteria group bacterium]|nr:ornithine cyclodeaminase [Patescibacteria group bacterium]